MSETVPRLPSVPDRAMMKAIMEAAILAPSPDNNQPWLFRAGPDYLSIDADERRNLPSDVGFLYCWMALGAATENACIAARELGFEGHPVIQSATDEQGRAKPAVDIPFVMGGMPDPLFPQLRTRCTSRGLYSTRSIEAPVLAKLAKSIEAFKHTQLNWIQDRRLLRQLGWLIANSDRVRFEYQPFHEELYRQLRLTQAEAERTRDGLDARTLELPPGAAVMLNWLRPWGRMKWVHRLGLGRLFTVPSAFAVMRSGAVGVLSVDRRNSEQYLESGRAFQRLWLAATTEGLSLHPLGSLPIFLAHIELGDACELRADHQRRIRRLRAQFAKIMPDVGGRALAMLFRIGYAEPPGCRSLRRPVEEMTVEMPHVPSKE